MISWHVARIGCGEGNIWQCRELLDGMQMQPLVSSAPRRTNPLGFFEDDEIQSRLSKAATYRESCRAGANDDNLCGFSHVLFPLLQQVPQWRLILDD